MKTREEIIAELEGELLRLSPEQRVEPTFATETGEELSPQDIIDQIKADTELGRSLLQVRMKLEEELKQ